MRGAAAAVSTPSTARSAAVHHARQKRTGPRWPVHRGTAARDKLAAVLYAEAFGDMRADKLAGCFAEWQSRRIAEARARGQDALADLWHIPRAALRKSIEDGKPCSCKRKNDPADSRSESARKRRRRNSAAECAHNVTPLRTSERGDTEARFSAFRATAHGVQEKAALKIAELESYIKDLKNELTAKEREWNALERGENHATTRKRREFVERVQRELQEPLREAKESARLAEVAAATAAQRALRCITAAQQRQAAEVVKRKAAEAATLVATRDAEKAARAATRDKATLEENKRAAMKSMKAARRAQERAQERVRWLESKNDGLMDDLRKLEAEIKLAPARVDDVGAAFLALLGTPKSRGAYSYKCRLMLLDMLSYGLSAGKIQGALRAFVRVVVPAAVEGVDFRIPSKTLIGSLRKALGPLALFVAARAVEACQARGDVWHVKHDATDHKTESSLAVIIFVENSATDSFETYPLPLLFPKDGTASEEAKCVLSQLAGSPAYGVVAAVKITLSNLASIGSDNASTASACTAIIQAAQKCERDRARASSAAAAAAGAAAAAAAAAATATTPHRTAALGM